MPPKARSVRPAKQQSTIPLICTLCPKHPNFSDTSHLLTHISSKSHLAARFKLQIRCQTEKEARDTLEDFDMWYQTNNLDSLLSTRLAMKDQKKAAKERRNVENRGLVPVKREPAMKKEAAKKEETQADDESVLQKTPVYRAPVPRMALWPTNRTGERPGTPGEDDWASTNVYGTPTAVSRIPGHEQGGGNAESSNMLDPRLITPQKAPVGRSDESKSTDSATRLKGIYWPGMDLFDSATPNMKKRRNQKKDSNVMDRMMAVSADVEPNEVSYFANGNYRASKDLFGPLSSVETSPFSEKEPTPKKWRTRKHAMGDVSVNAPRLRAPRRAKAAGTGSPSKNTSIEHTKSMGDRGITTSNPLKGGSMVNPLSAASFGNAFKPTPEEDAEFKLTIGNMKHKQFQIFQDGQPEQSPARTETSLEDNRFEFSSNHETAAPHHGLPGPFHSSMASSSLMSPTPAPRLNSNGIRIYGKENGKPEVPTGLQNRAPAPLTAHVFPSQIFYDAALNPLYNAYAAQTFGYSDPDLNFKANKPPGLSSSFHGDFRPTSTTAPASRSHSLTAITDIDNNDDGDSGGRPDDGIHYNM